jgi:hypothetical protein
MAADAAIPIGAVLAVDRGRILLGVHGHREDFPRRERKLQVRTLVAVQTSCILW